MHASTPARPESADRPMGPHRARTDHSGDSALRRRTTMRRFENLSLRARLLCSFGLVLLLLAVVALAAVRGAISQNRLSDQRTGLDRVAAATQDIRFLLAGANRAHAAIRALRSSGVPSGDSQAGSGRCGAARSAAIRPSPARTAHAHIASMNPLVKVAAV